MFVTAKPLFTAAKTFALGNQSHAKKKATGSLRRMNLRLGLRRRALQKLAIFFFIIFGPFKGPFSKAYKFLGFLDLSKGSVLEGEHIL